MTNTAASAFMKNLRTHLSKQFSEDFYVGTLYVGDNTITYFPFTPKELKELKLKIAIVYNQSNNQFEIWLAGQNKNIQKKYWDIFKGSDWNKYNIPSNVTNGFSIVDDIIIRNPQFNDFDSLTNTIQTKSLKFIKDILEVLLIE